MPTRRSFIQYISVPGTFALASLREGGIEHILAATRSSNPTRTPEETAGDEDFWHQIQQAFSVDRSLINLNNGGVSPSPQVVLEAMRRYLEFSNQAPTYTMWQILEPQIEGVRRRLATHFGCSPDELAITRNASEGLETCQLGLELKPGDEVLTTNQDYPRMLTTWRQRERRDGIVLKTISIPVPAPSLEEIAERIEKAITPKTRIIMVCHVINLTGQILPIRRICEIGRRRGIEVIVDGAHAFAHFPFKLSDLDCDYYGTSLHKWLMAPHGTGFLYVRKEKIGKVWPLMAAPKEMIENIRKFEEIGTHPAANHQAIAEALTFHEGIGIERKAARLRYLKERWVRRLEGQKGVRVLTPSDPTQSCGLALLNLEGTDPGKLSSHLFSERRIITTPIVHPEFQGIRVTPSVYTTLPEIDIFCDAIERALKNGLPAA
jgi:isopenicillin-N epimerase